MNRKIDDYRKSTVQFFGFKFETKTFLVTMAIALGAFLILLALTIFNLPVSWYGVLFGTGFLVALALSGQLCKERSINPDFPYTLVWWVFPFSIIGARIYFLVFNGGLDSFADIIRIWDGGLAIYGGILGGLLGLICCCLVHKVDIWAMTDVAAPLLAIGQAFGRIGCIFGGCCYGVEVTNKALCWFPISLKIGDHYHYATNFYEAILDFGLFILLTTLLRKVKIKGVPTFAYMFGYGLIRFVLEYFRDADQTLYLGNFPVSQLVSIGCILGGVAGLCTLLFVNNRKRKV